MTRIRSLCLFCGSRPGTDPVHAETAAALGRLLAVNRVTLVYGGGAVGLMGVAARAAKAAGGEVVGIIPRTLMRDEIAQQGLDELTVVETLHERKALMHVKSDVFLALPGSVGTLDELFEAVTWRELGIHSKPIWLLGANSYWAPFMALLRHLDAQGFAPPDLFEIVEPLDGIAGLASRLG